MAGTDVWSVNSGGRISQVTNMEPVRVRRSGDAAKLEKKLEERYDAEDYLGTPDRVVEWISIALDGEHVKLELPEEHFKSIGWRTINFWLRDGVALCKLINKLLAASGRPCIKYNTKANTAFVAYSNIENFNKGCLEYGLAEIDCFSSIDLYEVRKGPFLNVISCLHKLGLEGNHQNFQPEYEPPIPV